VTDNDDEVCAITVTFSGGPPGAKSQMSMIIYGFIESVHI
jgi:hypothetical protein